MAVAITWPDKRHREKSLLIHKIENYTIKLYNLTRYYFSWNSYPLFLDMASLVWAELLGLGPRYFFSYYPGHWIPPSVSITQGVGITLTYPQFHSNRPLWNVFTVSLKWPMMQLIIIGVTGRPAIVDNCLNRHWSTTFVSIELEIPPVTPRITIDPQVSLKWDFERSMYRTSTCWKYTPVREKRRGKCRSFRLFRAWSGD